MTTYYYPTIDGLPLYSLEEQKELAGRAKEGDFEAAGQLILNTFRLIVRASRNIAIKYNLYHEDFEDAVHTGVEACYYAMTKYDPAEGHWWTYARNWVVKDVSQFCADRKRGNSTNWQMTGDPSETDFMESSIEAPWAQVEKDGVKEIVRQSLKDLPEWQADEFMEYMFLSGAEIKNTQDVADKFGVSRTTVYNRLNRFIAFLKQDLEWIR